MLNMVRVEWWMLGVELPRPTWPGLESLKWKESKVLVCWLSRLCTATCRQEKACGSWFQEIRLQLSCVDPLLGP